MQMTTTLYVLCAERFEPFMFRLLKVNTKKYAFVILNNHIICNSVWFTHIGFLLFVVPVYLFMH